MLARALHDCCVTAPVQRHAVIRAYYHLLAFCYLPLCLMTMRFLDCRKDGSTYVLTSNPNTVCYDKVG